MSRLRVLLISPYISRHATGESFVAYKWAEALQDRVDLTVMALQSPNHPPLQEQLPNARAITWPRPKIFDKTEKFRAMFKPEWPGFSRQVRSFLAANASQFDIAHQIMPLAMRYWSPLSGFDLPYVIGPLGGTLDTPPAFAHEVVKTKWYTRLRVLDTLRLKYDLRLRRDYKEAALILGVAPYVADRLQGLDIRRYENMLELGIDAITENTRRTSTGAGDIHLLHVGRAVRTKGLRDVIRAMAILKDRYPVRLTSAGNGEEIAICKAEAEKLGLGDRVTFLGAIPRQEVEKLYAQADIFVFPSFREPTGNVLYEAMSWGLPIITAAAGGPNFIIDDESGIRIPVTNPEIFARDIAQAIGRLIDDPTLRDRLGNGAKAKVSREGLWPKKADQLVQEYYRCLEDQPGR